MSGAVAMLQCGTQVAVGTTQEALEEHQSESSTRAYYSAAYVNLDVLPLVLHET